MASRSGGSSKSKGGQAKNQKLMDFLGPNWEGGQEGTHDEVHGATKSSEEMEQYCLSEDMGDIERLEHYLSSTLLLQNTCGVCTFPPLAKEHGAAVTSKLLPKMVALCSRDEIDLLLNISDSLLTLLENNSLSINDMKIMLPPCFKLLQSTNEDVQQCYVDVIVAAIDKLAPQQLEEFVLGPSLAAGEVQTSVTSRVICCKLLGKLATRMTPKVVSEKFFFKAMSLCQDTAHEVRAVMCDQLNSIARGVGPELTHSSLLEELNELLSDEEALVRSSALGAVVDLLDFFNEDAKKSKVLPQLRSLCKETPDAVIYALADKSGELFWKQRDTLTEDKDSEVFYNFYKKIAANPDVELRYRCVFNLPGVVQALGAKRYPVHLDAVVRKLADDSDASVRLQLARGFHEITAFLASDKSLRLLKDPLLTLLKDSDVGVKELMLEQLREIVGHFGQISPAEDRAAIMKDILSTLAEVEPTLRGNWRRTAKYLNVFDNAGEYFTEQHIYECAVPVFSLHMSDSAQPVREKATRLMCDFIRASRNMQHRFELTQRLVRDFGRGRSFSQRMLFFEICTNVFTRFSRHFFRQYFYEPALDLMTDSVPNVRLRMCKLLPGIKKILRLPEDQSQLDRVQNCMNRLLRDSDNDVVEAAKQVSENVLGPLTITPAEEAKDREKRSDEEAVQRLEAEATKRRMVDEATERAKLLGAGGGAGVKAGVGMKASDHTALKKLPSTGSSSSTPARSAGSSIAQKVSAIPKSGATTSSTTTGSRPPMGTKTAIAGAKPLGGKEPASSVGSAGAGGSRVGAGAVGKVGAAAGATGAGAKTTPGAGAASKVGASAAPKVTAGRGTGVGRGKTAASPRI